MVGFFSQFGKNDNNLKSWLSDEIVEACNDIVVLKNISESIVDKKLDVNQISDNLDYVKAREVLDRYVEVLQGHFQFLFSSAIKISYRQININDKLGMLELLASLRQCITFYTTNAVSAKYLASIGLIGDVDYERYSNSHKSVLRKLEETTLKFESVIEGLNS